MNEEPYSRRRRLRLRDHAAGPRPLADSSEVWFTARSGSQQHRVDWAKGIAAGRFRFRRGQRMPESFSGRRRGRGSFILLRRAQAAWRNPSRSATSCPSCWPGVVTPGCSRGQLRRGLERSGRSGDRRQLAGRPGPPRRARGAGGQFDPDAGAVVRKSPSAGPARRAGAGRKNSRSEIPRRSDRVTYARCNRLIGFASPRSAGPQTPLPSGRGQGEGASAHNLAKRWNGHCAASVMGWQPLLPQRLAGADNAASFRARARRTTLTRPLPGRERGSGNIPLPGRERKWRQNPSPLQGEGRVRVRRPVTWQSVGTDTALRPATALHRSWDGSRCCRNASPAQIMLRVFAPVQGEPPSPGLSLEGRGVAAKSLALQGEGRVRVSLFRCMVSIIRWGVSPALFRQPLARRRQSAVSAAHPAHT